MKEKKQKWISQQNPLRWHKKVRYENSQAPDVERWVFEQVYDYAIYLEDSLIAIETKARAEIVDVEVGTGYYSKDGYWIDS